MLVRPGRSCGIGALTLCVTSGTMSVPDIVPAATTGSIRIVGWGSRPNP